MSIESAALLLRLEARDDGDRSPPKGIVYVAETTYDLNPERDRIRRMLQQDRYEVRPRKTLQALRAPEIRRMVADRLRT